MHGRMTVAGSLGFFVLLLGFCCHAAPAASGELDANDRYENDALPPEVVKAINVPKQVYAYLWGLGWLNSQFQDKFYFKGDTRQLNDMLDALAVLAKAKDSEMTASIISAPGRETRTVGPTGQKLELAFDWAVKIE